MVKPNSKHSRMLYFALLIILPLSLASEESSDLMAVESIAAPAYKVQAISAGSSAKYGYPYLIAPTLTPVIQARSDGNEDEGSRVATSQEKPFGSRLSASGGEVPVKKSHLKKSKVPPTYEAARRHDEDVSVVRPFRSYKEPKYRNFDDLENDFKPRRRMDVGPYSQYEYSRDFSPTREVSPRDPYLSPSNEPTDSFYPTVPKIKSYSAAYGPSHGSNPKYGSGRYEDPLPYYDEVSNYGGPSPSYPPTRDHYNYKEYSIKSNEPIMGDIRKRLLNYAGASELYEGEPDYLREVSRNKYKYGNIGNDYYSYGGQGHRDSYRDFPYIESKISLIKKSRRV